MKQPHRPECDGTTDRQTANCGRAAVWAIGRPTDPDHSYAACALHLHQVGAWLLRGERGELLIHRIWTEER